MKPITMTVPVSPWARVTTAGTPNWMQTSMKSLKVPMGFSLKERVRAIMIRMDSLANSQGCSVRPQPSFSQALTPEMAVEASSVKISSASTPQ